MTQEEISRKVRLVAAFCYGAVTATAFCCAAFYVWGRPAIDAGVRAQAQDLAHDPADVALSCVYFWLSGTHADIPVAVKDLCGVPTPEHPPSLR